MSAPAPERAARGPTLLALGYTLALVALAVVPGPPGDAPGSLLGLLRPELQNLLHVPIYALLSWLWCRAIAARGRTGRAAGVLGFSLAAGYAVFEELLQAFVPGRYSSLTDVLLDLLGAGLGVLLFWYARRDGGERTWAR